MSDYVTFISGVYNYYLPVLDLPPVFGGTGKSSYTGSPRHRKVLLQLWDTRQENFLYRRRAAAPLPPLRYRKASPQIPINPQTDVTPK